MTRHDFAPLFLAVVFVAGLCVRAPAGEPPITQAELVRRTHDLFDAIPSGDQAPYRKYFADDCLYHDEKGHSFDKTTLLADVTPFPKGYSGTIKLLNVKSLLTPDCAILAYDLDESETIFGQELHARYHQTDTWLLRNGAWQIAGTEVMRYYEDPAEGKADPVKFGAFVGTYELSKDSDRRTVVSVENGQLMIEKTPGVKTPLFPEAGDLFFRKGVEGRMLFRPGADGKVDALIDRRNNEDVVWKKIG